MIIVLEGVNGTGKSTYARRLAGGLNAAVIRPFRQGPDHHFTGDTPMERELKAFGVPYNTHVDELYTADFLGRMIKAGQRPGAVLDRSVASCIVHGDRPVSDASSLVNLWSRLLGADAPVVYVWLTAPWHIAEARLKADGRKHDLGSGDIHNNRQRTFRHVYDLIAYPKLEIDTGVTFVDDGLKQIIDLTLGTFDKFLKRRAATFGQD